MLDRKFILENVATVQQSCADRGTPVDVARFAVLEAQRRELQQQVEQLNARANQVSKSIGKAANEQERETRKEEGRQLRDQKDARQRELDRLTAEADIIYRSIPNLSHPDAPRGERPSTSNCGTERSTCGLSDFPCEIMSSWEFSTI